MTDYKKKLLDIVSKKGLRNLYYMGLISTVKEVYIVNFKVSIDNIDSVGVKQVLRPKGGKDYTSIMLKNFLQPEFGSIKVYKSKKRIELRLKKDIINNPYAVKIYDNKTAISDGTGDDFEEDDE